MNSTSNKICILIAFSLCLCFLSVAPSYASIYVKDSIQSYVGKTGIRVTVNDVELYFNASNGGEITQYYDLFIDPNRSRNLVNIEWKPYCNLLPLFTSLFYNPYSGKVLSTGGDSSAMVELIANTSGYVILQTSSRIMSRSGEIAKDVFGNAIYVNSTWVIRSSGLISVERTFFAPAYYVISSGWRWYPFYVTRRAGFDYNGTFYMFNTTYAYASVVNEATYRDKFVLFPLLPNDTRYVFGVALPFSNTSIGGDGAHNILIAYKYDELVNVNEWRADDYYSKKNNVTESGAVYEFGKTSNVSTHTYHMIVNFTHYPIDEESVQQFAGYYADNTALALLMECSVATNKELYKPGDYYAFYGSGKSYYNFIGLTATLTIKNSSNRIVYQRGYGPGNIMAGQTFNLTLLTGTVGSDSVPDKYTILFQIFSSVRIVLASSSRAITVSTP